MDDGRVVECSREVAVIYYLTKGWRSEWGGHLLDLEGGTTVVPEFNSAIAFTIPRYHQVTPVTGPNPRYSVSAPNAPGRLGRGWVSELAGAWACGRTLAEDAGTRLQGPCVAAPLRLPCLAC
jgi:Rps23 Pro-64 3,4-dihydroxylase Tpa1-like proline 4-hydroxylase